VSKPLTAEGSKFAVLGSTRHYRKIEETQTPVNLQNKVSRGSLPQRSYWQLVR